MEDLIEETETLIEAHQDLEGDRDLAEFLASVLERAGLNLDKTAIHDQGTCSRYEFIVAVEEDYETRSRVPKK